MEEALEAHVEHIRDLRNSLSDFLYYRDIDHDGVSLLENRKIWDKADSVLDAGFEEYKDSISDAKERVLVEALVECVDVTETTEEDANMQKAIIEALKQARAALASVKEV